MKVIERSRENNYNIMRFAAAMMVLFGHMCPLTGRDEILFLGQPIQAIGVKIFFLISGFLITNSFIHDSNPLRYGIRRFFRIIPGLAGVTILSVLVVGPLCTYLTPGEYFAHPVTWAYLKNIILNVQYFLPGVFTENFYPNAVNGSFWTLPVEVAMYIGVPVILLIFAKRSKIWILGFMALLTELLFLVQQLFFPDGRLVIYGTDLVQALAIVPYFFLGAVFSSEKVRKYLNLQLAAAILLGAAMLPVELHGLGVIAFFVLPFFVFSFALVPGPVFARCFSKNDFSYGIYLYGFLIQQIVMSLFGDKGYSFLVYLGISAAGTLACGVFSWFVIEKPAQNLGKRLLRIPGIAGLKKFTLTDIDGN